MCDKKNYVLFTDSECLVLSPNFKLPDENQILLKIPRQDNMYSFDMKNIVPKDGLTCLVAKATSEESMLWHRRLGHVNFKNINKLVKENLVRDLPLKRFENDQTCVTCLKGNNTQASYDETTEILKNFIKEIENLVDKKVKIIRSDNGTEIKNKVMDKFCREKGIKREYSIARTPQQNGVAKRKNRTVIEAARTMLADSKLPTTFWAEAVSTASMYRKVVSMKEVSSDLIHVFLFLPLSSKNQRNSQALLRDPAWVEANVGGTSLQYKTAKKDEIGIAIRNKAILLLKDITKKSKDYDEVLCPCG
ncbi:ribonuclease H-like domain-containing protein [Tanacetum coccineum]|uniref:Ribonuclease H-like domain-containing protein n=1 Tax=Tanacetum coccineum TaxID=301880 RepID=A0ABQ5CHV5_9ASTR